MGTSLLAHIIFIITLSYHFFCPVFPHQYNGWDYVISGEVVTQISEAVASLGHGDPLPAAEVLTELSATVLAFAWTLKEMRTSRVETAELLDEYLNPPENPDLFEED